MISTKYDGPHITHAELSAKLKDPQQIIIFDVREFDEYSTSHLKNSIHLSPSTPVEEFFKLYAKKIKSKEVIFYCSVGARSSLYLDKVKKKLQTKAYNLKGGIFRWYNEGKNIYVKKKVTHEIHPYDSYWGRLIEKRKP